MTDAITPPPRPAQSDSLLRKALDKAAKSTDATGMPVLQGGGRAAPDAGQGRQQRRFGGVW